MNDDEIINLFLKRDENGIIELSTKYHPYCYKIAWNLSLIHIYYDERTSTWCISSTCTVPSY